MSVHLVFGSSGEIGSKIVDIHLERGRSVIGVSRVNEFSDQNFHHMTCDLSCDDDIGEVIEKLESDVDIESVVFAHGAVLEGHFLTTKLDQFFANISLNLQSTIQILHAICRKMTKQRFGSIIIIGSSVTARMHYGNLAYATSKYALEGFCKGLALEMARLRVGVYNIAPGLIPSRLAEHATLRAKENKAYRFTPPEDVALLVDMLTSSPNLSMSGQVFYVNLQMDHL